jgi:hypothetical protein
MARVKWSELAQSGLLAAGSIASRLRMLFAPEFAAIVALNLTVLLLFFTISGGVGNGDDRQKSGDGNWLFPDPRIPRAI